MLSGFNIAFLNIIFCTFFSFITAPLVKRIGEKFNIIDIPDSRKVHTYPIVRIGGLSIFTTFFLYYFILNNLLDTNIFYNDSIINLSSIFVGAFLFFLVGIHDDVFKSSPLLRLFLQFSIAFVVALCGINFGTLTFTFPFFGNINFTLPQFLNYIITSFWIVGITNSINWLDGIDALAAGYGSILAIGLCLLMILKGNMIGIIYFSILFGSILGFLIRNFKPAFYIMGDCGSNFLGFCFSASTLIFLNDSSSNSINIFYLLILFSLPIGDMLFVILSRLVKGKNIFLPDKSHLHHRLINLNFGYSKIIFYLYSYSSCSIIFAIYSLNNF